MKRLEAFVPPGAPNHGEFEPIGNEEGKMTGRLNALAVVAAMGLMFAPLSRGADAKPLRLINVTGDAIVQAVPDEVILRLGVETHDMVMKTAKDENDKRVKAILAVAKREDIDPKRVQTDYISIEPRYRYNDFSNEFIGYYVRKSIQIRLRDLSKFESVLSESLEAGANYVHGIEFRTTKLRAYRDHARAMAIRAAREKAEAMTRELGKKIGDPQSISEYYGGWRPSYNPGWAGAWGGVPQAQNAVSNAGGDGPISTEDVLAPGQIAVSAQVTVSFEIK
jgi:uncharacterized protein YggE